MKSNNLSLVVLGGLVLIIFLQAVLYASTNFQNQRLERQIAAISESLETLQSITKGELVAGIAKIQTEITKKTLSPEEPLPLDLSEADPDSLLSAPKLSQTLGASITPTPIPTKFTNIKLKTGLSTIVAYETTRTSSRVTGELQVNKVYPLISKQTDWYLIKLDDQTNAWVQTQFVNETN